MASLKDLKNRISSVKSTQKITKAKKMVAAAKLRRAQEAVEAARPYAEKMENVMSSLGASVADGTGPKLLAGTGEDNVHLLVVATSDRGLAGAFNANIVKKAVAVAERLRGQGKTVKFFLMGKKGRAVIRRLFPSDIVHFQDFADIKNPTFDHAKSVADDILARFEEGEFDVAHFFFSKFKSALSQDPTEQQLIPAPMDEDGEAAEGVQSSIEYEPSEEGILEELLPRNVAVQIFKGLLENAASEQGASMTAMDNATRNAGDLIDKLTIQYNRQRQAAITTELVEIISGAEAL